MKLVIQCLVIVLLLAIYAAAFVAVLRPHVTPEYRAFFINRTTVDYNPAHYDSKPEEGMVFSRPGVPQWVSGTHGFSMREELGRWTDEDLGNSAGLTFTREFTGDVCVDASFRAIPWLVGDTITLRMGDQQKQFQVRSADLTDYRLQLSAVQHGTSVDFILPPKLPAVNERVHDSGDPRRLGISVVDLKLIPGECPVPSS